MKVIEIEELGISPAPWKISDSGKTNGCIVDAEGTICASGAPTGCPPANANLIAAAPELYECLREAVIGMCHDCDDNYEDDGCVNTAGACYVQRWRKALAKAAGEEVK